MHSNIERNSWMRTHRVSNLNSLTEYMVQFIFFNLGEFVCNVRITKTLCRGDDLLYSSMSTCSIWISFFISSPWKLQVNLSLILSKYEVSFPLDSTRRAVMRFVDSHNTHLYYLLPHWPLPKSISWRYWPANAVCSALANLNCVMPGMQHAQCGFDSIRLFFALGCETLGAALSARAAKQ